MITPTQVQHLIEKCICYNLNREECMETLEKHAKIMPVITSTGKSLFGFPCLPYLKFIILIITASTICIVLNFRAHF